MKKAYLLKVTGILLAGFFLLGVPVSTVSAQPTQYQILAQYNDRPQVFFNVFTLPGDQPNELLLTTTFQLSYNALSFRKLNNSSRKADFYSTAELNMELFKSPEANLEPYEEVDIQGLESTGRATWRDTAFAATYQQTQSREYGLQGSMQIPVSPGDYTYLIQRGKEGTQGLPYPRFRTDRREASGEITGARTRNIHIDAYGQRPAEHVFLAGSVDKPEHPSRIDLYNMGNNVPFGKDFYAFIPIVNYNADATYTLQVDRINIQEDDTTQVNQLVKQPIAPPAFMHNIRPVITSDADNVALKLQKEQPAGYTYALLHIPNSRFPNAVYRLTVTSDQSEQPVAQSIYRSYWSDMPTSLLSLDVAIDMLRFITGNETLEKINSGSNAERERKFREFWEAKDPTPKTAFNELQAEYYRRIDYAFKNFGSQNVLGFNSDRGRIYINYGPPNDIRRTFPADGATTEVWTYDNRKFIFKATSGFGDFKLVSQ